MKIACTAFVLMLVTSYGCVTDDLVVDPVQLGDVVEDTVLERSLDVYGLKLIALPALGRVVGVEDDFVKKVAQTVKMILNPNAPDIDTEF